MRSVLIPVGQVCVLNVNGTKVIGVIVEPGTMLTVDGDIIGLPDVVMMCQEGVPSFVSELLIKAFYAYVEATKCQKKLNDPLERLQPYQCGMLMSALSKNKEIIKQCIGQLKGTYKFSADSLAPLVEVLCSLLRNIRSENYPVTVQVRSTVGQDSFEIFYEKKAPVEHAKTLGTNDNIVHDVFTAIANRGIAAELNAWTDVSTITESNTLTKCYKLIVKVKAEDVFTLKNIIYNLQLMVEV